MTENEHATDRTLTEGAVAPAKARAYRCPLARHVWDCACPQAHHTYAGCPCLTCCTARYWRAAHVADTATTKEEHDAWSPTLERLQRYIDEATEHVTLAEEMQRKRTLHEQNRANAKSQLGTWEFTLTYSPKKHGWLASDAEDAMRTAIERLARYYADEIEEFHAVGERTQAGQPHVHAWYRLRGGRKMTTKNMRRAYPIWNERHKLGTGHEGGHHAPVKRTADFAGYIEKDLDTAWLIHNTTNEPRPEEASVPEEEDDHPSPDGTSGSPTAAEPHDG